MRRSRRFFGVLWIVFFCALTSDATSSQRLRVRVFANGFDVGSLVVLNGVVSHTVIAQSGKRYLKIVFGGFPASAIEPYLNGEREFEVEIVKNKACRETPKFVTAHEQVPTSTTEPEGSGLRPFPPSDEYVLAAHFRDLPIPKLGSLECYDAMKAVGVKGHLPLI